MKYISTRGQDLNQYSISKALEMTLATDGGLLVPKQFPKFNFQDFLEDDLDYKTLCERVLKPFFADDPLVESLHDICTKAFNFPIILNNLNDKKNNIFLLELFHGPTAAFKDFGARFLSNSIRSKTKKTLLVATSGDTGGAVASSFWHNDSVEVFILYPKGGVSELQEKQLTCWCDNVHALRINGTFDDCQRLVKEAFVDNELKSKKSLISANSINIGRLLPQMTYYIWSSLNIYKKTNKFASYIVPSGNLGNVTSCIWAKKIGFPIDNIVLSVNANPTLPNYYKSGVWQPSKSIATLANAMDVGSPSNIERIFNLFPDFNEFRKNLSVYSVNDNQIQNTMDAHPFNQTICPHTATGFYVYQNILDKSLTENSPWIILATAHAAKFGATTDLPESLEWIKNRKSFLTDLEPKLSELKKMVE
ncbi:MAG: threonine synthase [Bacteriovoracaceae bacterium]